MMLLMSCTQQTVTVPCQLHIAFNICDSFLAGSAAVASAFVPHAAEAKHVQSRSECQPEDVLMMSADGLLTRHRLRLPSHAHSKIHQPNGIYGSTSDSVIR